MYSIHVCLLPQGPRLTLHKQTLIFDACEGEFKFLEETTENRDERSDVCENDFTISRLDSCPSNIHKSPDSVIAKSNKLSLKAQLVVISDTILGHHAT